MEKRVLIIFSFMLCFLVSGVWASVHTLQIIGSDLTAPDVKIIYPSNVTYNYSISSINYSVSDKIKTDKCWYSFDSGKTNSSFLDAGMNFSNVNISLGWNNLIVYCNDSSGNIGFNDVSFFINITKPISNVIYLNSCMALNKTNGIYVLNKSLNVKGDCFKIKANNITLDLNGKNITGNGNGFGISNIGYSSLAVKNGSINDFLIGINNYADNSSFYDLSIKSHSVIWIFWVINRKTGIFISGNGNVISSVSISGNYQGIYLLNGKNNRIRNSSSCRNVLFDFFCVNSKNTSGNNNSFGKLNKCPGGWPVLGKDYKKC